MFGGQFANDDERVAVVFQLKEERALVGTAVGMVQHDHRRAVEAMEDHPVVGPCQVSRSLLLYTPTP